MPSTLLEQCVHEKLKLLPEETVGQAGYSWANLCKNVSQNEISEHCILSYLLLNCFEEWWQFCFQF